MTKNATMIYVGAVAMIICVVAWQLHWQHRAMDAGAKKQWRRYMPLLPQVELIPVISLWILPVMLFFGEIAGIVFSDFLVSVCLYTLVLLLVLPLLRRYFSARCCAVVWLLPSLLYYLGMALRIYRTPLLVIPVRETWVRTAGIIWTWGCLAVMAWKVTEHMLFRRRILREAELVEEKTVLDIWKQEMLRVFPQRLDMDLAVSSEVRSPLSVGVLQSTTVVILPRRAYSDEELRLILRHELVHISRRDGMNKLFLNFCCAMCWFNPLVWLSMRKSAEDLELSCDETVLLEEPEPVRRAYAELLLSTAGEEKGFTTCLAASAGAMRYRLKNALQHRKLRSGALLVVALCLLLGASYGRVALGYGHATAQCAINARAGEEIVPETALLKTTQMPCTDLQALETVLEQMEVCCLVSGREDRSTVIATVTFSDGSRGELRQHTLTLRGGGEERTVFYITKGPEQTYIESLFG